MPDLTATHTHAKRYERIERELERVRQRERRVAMQRQNNQITCSRTSSRINSKRGTGKAAEREVAAAAGCTEVDPNASESLMASAPTKKPVDQRVN